MTESKPTADVVITRIFDAPRELVYQAFVDPDQLAQWYGPVGYSVPRDSIDIDARTGGHQRFMMVNDEDPTWQAPVNATFTEVIENELLLGVEDFVGVPGLQERTAMTMRIEFHDEDGKTRVVIRQGPFTREMQDMTRAGWGSSFTKLDTLLAP
jgi:uncharacterized protein YndB with AHSA1/START domain